MERTMTDESSEPPRLTFCKLVARDMERMVDFYTIALGFRKAEVIEADHFVETILRSKSGMTLVIYHHKDGREVVIGNGHGPIGFMVADIDGTFAEAVAHGAIGKRPPEIFSSSRTIAFLDDPEGHEIELIQLKE
jgi:lactoylglutathione lyase